MGVIPKEVVAGAAAEEEGLGEVVVVEEGEVDSAGEGILEVDS